MQVPLHGQTSDASPPAPSAGWFIFKNILGWFLILFSVPFGMALPGPNGIPVFLVGFALVTFPGKRRITARMLRGRAYTFHGRRRWWLAPVNLLLRIMSRARRTIRPWMRRRGINLLPPRRYRHKRELWEEIIQFESSFKVYLKEWFRKYKGWLGLTLAILIIAVLLIFIPGLRPWMHHR